MDPVTVPIFGVPTACAAGVNEAWRDIADWARRQLTIRFGEQVNVEYSHLFSPDIDRFPDAVSVLVSGEGHVPLVVVGEELLSSGGKVSLPAIRERFEALGLTVRY